MGKKIYGMDLSEKITPMMVRDAMMICFKKAHAEVLESMEEISKDTPKKEIDDMKNMQIEYLIKSKFKEVNADFDNPTKDNLIRVVESLAELASRFRSPKIIDKHYKEIIGLIEKLD